MVLVDERAQRIRRVSVQENIQLYQPCRTEVRHVVVEGGISLGDGFELVVKVKHHLAQRQVVIQFHAVRGNVMLAYQRAALVHAQLHDGTVKIGLGDNLGTDIGFFNMVDDGGRRQAGRVVHVNDLPLGGVHLVRHVGHGGDDVHVELAEQPLLHNFQVQQAQEAAAEAEAQGQRALRLVGKGGVVELELLQRSAQFLELGSIHRIQTGEDHRLYFFEACNGLCARTFHVRDGVAHLYFHGRLDAGDNVAYIPGTHLSGGVQLEFQVAYFLRLVLVAGGEEFHLVPLADGAVHHFKVGDDAAERVEHRVKDKRLQRSLRIPFGRGHLVHNGVQHFLHAGAGAGAHAKHVLRLAAQQVAHLVLHQVRLGAVHVNLVEHGNNLQPMVNGLIQVGNGLSLNTL